jgi:aspartokinase
MISTSEIKISCIIASSDAKEAVKQIHEKFELDAINIF